MRILRIRVGTMSVLAGLVALLLGAIPGMAGVIQLTLTDSPADDVTLSATPALGLKGLQGGIAEYVLTVRGPAQSVNLEFPFPACVAPEVPSRGADVTIVPSDPRAGVMKSPTSVRIVGLTISPNYTVEVRVRLRIHGQNGQACCAQATVTDAEGVTFVSSPTTPVNSRGYRDRSPDTLYGRACQGLATGFIVDDPAAPPAATE